ncbi:hypothetical protein [Paenibacillus harenae]|uniref:hypothetical protein n=1 Tax=Paenibacillus harenae TaxID=306543 RepID=UPI000415D009|nr:hypothetical protein [Paenibacillus harenae]
MVQGWVTVLVLAFGIIVAVVGVIAYLRMFRKDRLSASTRPKADESPPLQAYTANGAENGYKSEAKPEQASPHD